MSKIKIQNISDTEIHISIANDVPVDMVNELTKSLVSKGLTEDLTKSTISNRYFFIPQNRVNDLADKLIKSLSDMTKADQHTKTLWEGQAQQRLVLRNESRKKNGLAPITMDQYKNPTGSKPPAAAPPAPATPNSGAATLPGVANKLVDKDMSYSSTATNYKKSEDECSCGECEKCIEIKKSGYGPKGSSQYSVADNTRRKMNNTGSAVDLGPNANEKAYSTKPGQLSSKASAELTARLQNKANKKQPVKQWTPQEIQDENIKRGLKKGWGQHLPFPNAEEEMNRVSSMHTNQSGEDTMANQLATMMNSKAMLNANHRQPSSEDMLMMGESIGLGVSENVAKTADNSWNNTINNWLAEATKPISQRFSSEEEELAYWNSIKVNGSRDDDPSGY